MCWKVNNATADDDATNNALACNFKAAPTWPTTIVVRMTTNKGQTPDGFSETSWYLVEGGKDTIARREKADISKSYSDTLNLGPSYYQLIVKDANCDGLNFWNNSAAGTGSVSVRNPLTNTTLPLPEHFNGDFGCGFTHYFNVDWPAAISNINTDYKAAIEAYPNPASRNVNINISGIKQVKGVITILDGIGRVVMQQYCDKASLAIATDGFSNGVYTVIFIDENASNAKLQTRLVVAK